MGGIEWLDVSEAELALILESWGIVTQDFSKYGVRLYVKLLGDYPELKKYFSFAGSPEEIQNDPAVKKHSLRVMRTVGNFVKNASTKDAMYPLLKEVALNHRPRNIAVAEYDKLRATLVGLVAEAVGEEKATPELASAWNKVLTPMFKIITDVMEDQSITA